MYISRAVHLVLDKQFLLFSAFCRSLCRMEGFPLPTSACLVLPLFSSCLDVMDIVSNWIGCIYVFMNTGTHTDLHRHICAHTQQSKKIKEKETSNLKENREVFEGRREWEECSVLEHVIYFSLSTHLIWETYTSPKY